MVSGNAGDEWFTFSVPRYVYGVVSAKGVRVAAGDAAGEPVAAGEPDALGDPVALGVSDVPGTAAGVFVIDATTSTSWSLVA